MSTPAVDFDPETFDWRSAAAELVDVALAQDCADGASAAEVLAGMEARLSARARADIAAGEEPETWILEKLLEVQRRRADLPQARAERKVALALAEAERTGQPERQALSTVRHRAVDTLANRLLDRGTVDADAVEVLRAVRRAHERLAAGVATP